MVGTICSTGSGERTRKRQWVDSSIFFGAAITGAACIAMLAALLGSIMKSASDPTAATAVLITICLGAAAIEATGRRLPSPTRQVSKQWWGRFDSRLTSLGWGYQLGTGVVTRINSAAQWVIVAFVILSGTFLGVGVYILYGMVRGIQPMLVTALDNRVPWLRDVALHSRLHAVASGAASLLLLVMGGAILSMEVS